MRAHRAIVFSPLLRLFSRKTSERRHYFTANWAKLSLFPGQLLATSLLDTVYSSASASATSYHNDADMCTNVQQLYSCLTFIFIVAFTQIKNEGNKWKSYIFVSFLLKYTCSCIHDQLMIETQRCRHVVINDFLSRCIAIFLFIIILSFHRNDIIFH